MITNVRLAATALAIAAAFLWISAVVPSLFGPRFSWDLVVYYAAARALVVDTNPYDDSALKAAWIDSAPEGSALTPPGFYSLPMVYPPGALVVPLAIAGFEWPSARLLWLLFNSAALIGTLWIALRTWGAAWAPEARLLFVAYALLLNASRETILNGQMTPLVVLAITAGLALADRGKLLSSGICLGASLVKPTLGLGLVAAFALRGRLRLVGAAVVTAVLLNGIVLARIGFVDGPRLLGDLVELARSEEAILDPASTRVTKDLLSLEPLLHRLAGSEARGRPRTVVITAVLWLLGGAAGALLLRTWMRSSASLRELHLLEAVALVLSLLLVYHRAYDGLVLVPLLALLMADAPRLPAMESKWVLAVVALPLALFVGPHTPTALNLGGKLAALEQIVWVPHRVWGLIVLLAALMAIAYAGVAGVDRAVESITRRSVAWALALVIATGLAARVVVASAAANPPRFSLRAGGESPSAPAGLEPGLLLEHRRGLVPPGATLVRVVLLRDLDRQTLPKIEAGASTTELSGFLRFTSAGEWRLELAASDGARLWVGEHEVIDARGFHGFDANEAVLQVSTPGNYPLRIEHHSAFVGNEISLRWARGDADLEAVPLANLFHSATEPPSVERSSRSVTEKALPPR